MASCDLSPHRRWEMVICSTGAMAEASSSRAYTPKLLGKPLEKLLGKLLENRLRKLLGKTCARQIAV